MYFAKRRLLIRLLWAFVSNGVTPFILGAWFAFFLTSGAVFDAFATFDESGLGICKVATKGANND
jgi:hypothetical protein